MHYLK